MITKEVEVFLIGDNEEDAKKNSPVFFSRRSARIMATGSDYGEKNKRVFKTTAQVMLGTLEEV